MADGVFVDGQPLSTSYLNEMYTELLNLKATEAKRNITVDNTTGTVTYETRMHAVKTKPLKAGTTAKPYTVSFEVAKFPPSSTVFYTVTPEYSDEKPSAVYYKIDSSSSNSVTITYWTGKAEITASFHVIAVALIPKT